MNKPYSDGTGVNYAYDMLSRLTQVSDASGTYNFTYDNMGRLTQTSTQYAFLSAQTLVNNHTDDADSNRVSFRAGSPDFVVELRVPCPSVFEGRGF